MAKYLENDNPHNDAFRKFIETLDLELPELPENKATSELTLLQNSIGISTEMVLKGMYDDNAEQKVSKLVRDSLVEQGYIINTWDEYELGLYACVLEVPDFMVGGVITRQFRLPDDGGEKSLRRPIKSIREIRDIAPGFDLHVVAEYMIAIAHEVDRCANDLAKAANDSINHET